jgi:hypothetical protein
MIHQSREVQPMLCQQSIRFLPSELIHWPPFFLPVFIKIDLNVTDKKRKEKQDREN